MIQTAAQFAKLGYALIVFSLISLGLSGASLGAIKSASEAPKSSVQQHMSMMETMDMAAMRDRMASGCEDCEGMINRASSHCSFQATILPLLGMVFPSQLTGRDPLLQEQTPYARSFSPEPPPPRL